MPRVYQPALLPSGARNPRHKTRPTGRRGKKKNHFQFGEFCAWDGEGITVAGEHRYMLLANSSHDALWNPAGLGTLDILGAICARARQLDKRTTHVIFGGSYDVNCWLKDLSPRALEKVWRGGWVVLAQYRYKIQYRPRRSFVIHELETGTRVTVWDVWGFFQGTFVGALEKYGLTVPDRLRAMKQARSKFSLKQKERIIEYCHEECDLLVSLMKMVRDHLATANLAIRRWDGAGACAAALLSREGTKTHQGAAPAGARRAAQHAYAGGRIELLQYGHAPNTPLHHYDINSAYPAALRPIPSLAAGRWAHTNKPTDISQLPEFSVHRVHWYFTESNSRAYPFFWRGPNGNIFYPPLGEGWYWTPEVMAAQDALAARQIDGFMEVKESWSWHPETDERPFQFIDGLFQQRAEWKRTGVGAEKMLKLALNSLYGKCAQHVGGKPGEAPRYHQIEWAGWITSVTRAALYRAVVQAGPAAVMIATDGIFSTSQLNLPVSKQLGDWEYHCHAGATVVQSGVYWLDDINAQGERVTQDFSRGFDRGTLKRNKIVSAWKRRELTWDASLTRFVTMGAVVNRHARPEHWRQWRTTPRVLTLTPTGTKRTDRISIYDWKPRAGEHPAYGYIPTIPTIPAALFVGSHLSTAYPLPWAGDPPLIEQAENVAARFADWEAMEE